MRLPRRLVPLVAVGVVLATLTALPPAHAEETEPPLSPEEEAEFALAENLPPERPEPEGPTVNWEPEAMSLTIDGSAAPGLYTPRAAGTTFTGINTFGDLERKTGGSCGDDTTPIPRLGLTPTVVECRNYDARPVFIPADPAALPATEATLATNFAASVPSVVTPPEECRKTNVRAVDRFGTCAGYLFVIEMWEYSNSSARIVGAGTYGIITYQYMGSYSRRVVNQTSVRLLTRWGKFTTRNLTGDFYCSGGTGGCSGKTGDRLSISTPLSVTRYAIGYVDASPALGTMTTLKTHWVLRFTGQNYTQREAGIGLSARCDYRGQGAYSKDPYGCVVPGTVPDLWYSRSGKYPKFTAHVDKAIASGLESRLTRLTTAHDLSQIRQNRRLACPSWLPAPPTSYNCDEYPFATSTQGAASGGYSRVFSGCYLETTSGSGSVGYSRCYIPATQNSGAGGQLSWFLRDQRILRYDRYDVRIRD